MLNLLFSFLFIVNFKIVKNFVLNFTICVQTNMKFYRLKQDLFIYLRLNTTYFIVGPVAQSV